MGFNFICQVRFSFDSKDHCESFLQHYAIGAESFHLNDISSFKCSRKRKVRDQKENNKQISLEIMFRQILERTGFNFESIQQ